MIAQTFARSASAEWLDLLGEILTRGVEARPRNMLTREIAGAQTCVDMSRPVVAVAERKLGRRFLCAEAAWILSGDNRVRSIAPFSKEISRFSDDGVYFRGAYGPRIVDQLTYVVDAISSDPDTRQAVVDIWRPNPRPTKDVPCTLSVQWLVRDGRLDCFDTMRSSDAWLGWPYDVFNFSMLSCYVALLVRERCGARLRLGTLRLTAASQHLYETNFEPAREILLKRLATPVELIGRLDPHELAKASDLIDLLWDLARLQKEHDFDVITDERWSGIKFLRELVTGPDKKKDLPLAA